MPLPVVIFYILGYVSRATAGAKSGCGGVEAELSASLTHMRYVREYHS